MLGLVIFFLLLIIICMGWFIIKQDNKIERQRNELNIINQKLLNERRKKEYV